MATKSVNVPPTSMPMRISGATSRNKSTLDIIGTRRGAARRRIAPPSSAAGRNFEAVAWRHHYAGFLRADHARHTIGGVQNVVMWRTIRSAQYPAGAMARAIACRVGNRGLLCFDHESQESPRSPTKCAVSAGIRPEFMTRKEQRKSRLGYFQAAEFDAAGRMPLARARPTVARRRGAAARPGGGASPA